VRLEETNASEPLMTCRNVFRRRRNRDSDFYPASKDWELPADCPIGVRHEGGVTLRQASIRNTGTCRPDAKGASQAASGRKSLSTEGTTSSAGAEVCGVPTATAPAKDQGRFTAMMQIAPGNIRSAASIFSAIRSGRGRRRTVTANALLVFFQRLALRPPRGCGRACDVGDCIGATT